MNMADAKKQVDDAKVVVKSQEPSSDEEESKEEKDIEIVDSVEDAIEMEDEAEDQEDAILDEEIEVDLKDVQVKNNSKDATGSSRYDNLFNDEAEVATPELQISDVQQ